MRAILSAPGSRGDVNPMIAIGAALRRAGHEVVISLSEPYAHLAEAEGLIVEPVITREAFDQAVGTASVWKPIRGPIAVFRLIIARYLRLHDEVIQRHHRPGQTVLVAHPLDLASRVFRDAHPETPLATVLPQPVTLRTYHHPPRLSPWWFEIQRPAWALRAAYWMADRVVLDSIIRGPLNRLRAEYGLGGVSRVMDRWWLSPDLILAMFPEWYAPGTKDFAPHLIHCGFPLCDVDGAEFTAPEDRPIVFTAGTAHRHCKRFFEKAAAACDALQQPGLLLSSHAENFPAVLPDGVRTAGYVSLGQLLPHCAAIVHHGGIGTTSQALAAGIPQVICPLAFDQFDNANRVEQMHCGRWLRRESDLTLVLADVLDRRGSPPLIHAAQQLKGSHAAETARDALEHLALDQNAAQSRVGRTH